jgi:PAS domain S-box-containing protein
VALSTLNMHIVSELVVAAACFSAASAILWYVMKRRRLGDDNRRAGLLLFACFLCCGLSRLADLSLYLFPAYTVLSYVDAFLVAASLVCGLAVWPLLPGLANTPTTADLREANDKLAAQEAVRGALVNQLAGANRELEDRVASRTEELAESKRRFEAALRGSTISMSQQDRDLRYTWAYNLPGADDAQVIGATPHEKLPEHTANQLVAAKRRVLATGEAASFEFALAVDGETRWYEERVEPLVDNKAVVGVISTAVDVTARKRHEMELVELLRELTHRTKNVLAVVQGIARQTGESATSVEDFTTRFAGRLQALSLAHEMLVTASWRGIELRQLVEGVLRNVAPGAFHRVSFEGPAVSVTPEIAQTLVIAFHEMTSNAIQHGALAVPDGGLRISWTRAGRDDAPLLNFSWQEDGAPGGFSLARRGFGFSFVERLLPRAMNGQSSVTTDRGMLTWMLSFPWPCARQPDTTRGVRASPAE